MAVTIRDVAKASDVSIYTVSSVLHNKGDVGEKTRKKVEAVIRKLNYNPLGNIPLARRQAAMSIGLVTPAEPYEQDPFYHRAIAVVKSVSTQHGYNCALFSEENIELMAARQLPMDRGNMPGGGLIIFCPHRSAVRYMKVLDEWGIPQVVIRGDSPVKGVLSIRDDDYKGATLAMQHLHKLGHTRILFIGMNFYDGPSRGRLQAYKGYVKRHGLQSDSALVIDLHNLGNRNLGGLIQERRASPLNPTAIFCMTDVLVPQIIKPLTKAGLRVPDDLALVSYDNDHLAEIYNPGITSVNIPVTEMVTAACLHLMDSAHATQSGAAEMIFENTLVVRESCGTPAL